MKKVLPWILALLCAAYVASLPLKHERSSISDHLEDFGRIPVSSEGRVKPLDTFARNSLMTLSGRQSIAVEDKGPDGKIVKSVMPASAWYLEIIAEPDKADTRQIFRIDHPDIVSMLGIDEKRRIRFTMNEIRPHIEKIEQQANLAVDIPKKDRDLFQARIVELFEKLIAYQELKLGRNPYLLAPLADGQEWKPLSELLQDPSLEQYESTRFIVDILFAARGADSNGFNTSVEKYQARIAEALPADFNRSRAEVMFNVAAPFSSTAALYMFAFVLACLGFMTRTMQNSDWPRTLSRSALAVITVAFIVHTIGLAMRMYLQGRPPVTNLYSSAIFIGWACIPMAVAAEWFVRLGIGNAVAALIGFGTLIVAHNLSTGGDTMQMMQAVLDSNFWLATHVVVITIGYSAVFLAGFIAAGYLIFGAFTRRLAGDAMKSVPKMIYGVTCFACLTSFVGTVLGGIWADQSWGRFWGWDPKENGAALIVFITLIILHGRWGGMLKDRGVAVLAVFGNIVTAWSWFGTNMLGVGLHSYGFMDSAVFWLLAFCVSQLAIMAIGFIPVAKWRSMRTEDSVAAPVVVVKAE